MPRPLHEQTIVITGASSGIGRCAALHLAARGARIVAVARGAGRLASLVEEIRARGGQAVAVRADVSREADLREAAREAVARFGAIDTWVNAAGVYVQGTVRDVTPEEFRRILEVDLMGVVNGTRCALEVMLPRGEGVVVQVSSIMGRRGAAYSAPYAAAKAGIDGFSDAARTELWGTGVHVSTLYPPPVDTPIYRHGRGKLGTLSKPPPPILSPEAVARAIASLAVRPRPRRVVGAFGHLYVAAARFLPAGVLDAVLHRAAPLTRSAIPAGPDNLDAPIEEPGRVRDGWMDTGWRGATVRETARVFPTETALLAAAIGFAAGRISKRLR